MVSCHDNKNKTLFWYSIYFNFVCLPDCISVYHVHTVAVEAKKEHQMP